MIGRRLPLALDGGLDLPSGRIAVLGPRADDDLSAVPEAEIVTGFRPDFQSFESAGRTCRTALDGDYAAVVVRLPRAKAEAQMRIATAAMHAPLVIVDGAKEDGVDSILRACRARTAIHGPVNKAHGKLFWFEGGDFADWRAGPPQEIAPGFVTIPGVFSADGIDPGSAMLAGALPETMPGRVIDLGAGWGYLSAQVLTRPEVSAVDLVEADHAALDCARRNVPDPRAEFRWADARTWRGERADWVVMNPPFHQSRTADPTLGQDFIRAAAGNLAPRGQLIMVANRHLGYEAVLDACFGQWSEIAGDGRFKVIRAAKPKRG